MFFLDSVNISFYLKLIVSRFTSGRGSVYAELAWVSTTPLSIETSLLCSGLKGWGGFYHGHMRLNIECLKNGNAFTALLVLLITWAMMTISNQAAFLLVFITLNINKIFVLIIYPHFSQISCHDTSISRQSPGGSFQ